MYRFLHECLSLQFKSGAVDLGVIRNLNRKMLNHYPKTLAEALDVLSYEIISKDKSSNLTNVLK